MGGLRGWRPEGTGDASLAIEAFREGDDESGVPPGEVPGLLLRISRGLEDIDACLRAFTLQKRSLSPHSLHML